MNQPTLDAIKLQQGFNNFYAPRQEGDIDLVALVREALKHANLNDKIEIYNAHPLIKEAGDKQPAIQRWLLNRYWLIQLITVDTDSSNARMHLIPNGTEEDW